MAIQVLPDRVVSQIAAGEVVERPASVVKELVENALDAEAHEIQVIIEGSGRNLIRVSDDGCGIRESEANLVFTRHATSKLQSTADLLAIKTLGFRGEALASIAAVSRMTFITRTDDETVGTKLRFEDGLAKRESSVGAPQGTVISVENLFYNVPARLKFLKSDATERQHITRFVTRYALSNPDVRFQLKFEDRGIFHSSGSGVLREVLASVYGLEIARVMLEITSIYDDSIKVSGFISPPSLSRSNRREITLFVNGRWVQDVRLNVAVTQAYHTLLKGGRYPIVFLHVTLPPQDVDVNVHPAKTEVRFRNSNAVFRAVGKVVRRALLDKSPEPEMDARHWSSGEGVVLSSGSGSSRPAPHSQHLEFEARPGTGLAPSVIPVQYPLSNRGAPLLRVVGQVGAAYIVSEGPDGLYLIDQHAAHERILYEAFSEQAADSAVISQALLEPAVIEVLPEQVGLLNRKIEMLRAIGFAIEPFGGSTFLVRALPAVLESADPVQAIRVVVEEFEEDEAPLASESESRIIARVCKRAAVKSGQTLSHTEQVELVRRLEVCQAPQTCPHGRPTMIHISVSSLEKQFGRK